MTVRLGVEYEEWRCCSMGHVTSSVAGCARAGCVDPAPIRLGDYPEVITYILLAGHTDHRAIHDLLFRRGAWGFDQVAHLSMPDYQAIFKGNWSTLPRRCSGNLAIMNQGQTIGCPECGQNLWYTPCNSSVDCLPHWLEGDLRDRAIESASIELGDSEPFWEILWVVHPWAFDDAHDPGDEDSEEWPAQDLYLETITREKFPAQD